MDGIEYKLFQYADDTSVIFYGSPKSIYGILGVIDYFADPSGLKINNTKLKLIGLEVRNFQEMCITTYDGN